MTANTQTTQFTVPVERIAWLIRNLDRQQKARLLQLVPDLQTIRPEEANIPVEQEALMDYFQHKRNALSKHLPMQDNDPFWGGLTVAEFFALPEEEQSRIWDQAHAEAERSSGDYEQSIRPDALPAR